jgi:hypothetical protein
VRDHPPPAVIESDQWVVRQGNENFGLKDKIGKPLEIVGSWSDVAKPVKTQLIGRPRQQ